MVFSFCEKAGFLAFARQRVFPGGGPSDVFGALHAEGNYSSGHCSGLPPDSLSTHLLCPHEGGDESVGITICAANLQQNAKSEKCFAYKKGEVV